VRFHHDVHTQQGIYSVRRAVTKEEIHILIRQADKMLLNTEAFVHEEREESRFFIK